MAGKEWAVKARLMASAHDACECSPEVMRRPTFIAKGRLPALLQEVELLKLIKDM